jgi:hypothetical protein
VPSGAPPGSPHGGSSAGGFGCRVRPRGPLTSGRITPTGRHCHREKPRTGPGGKPQESRSIPRGVGLPVCVQNPWSAGSRSSPRTAGESAGGTCPGSRVRAARGTLWRGENAHESIGLSGPRSAAGTDLRGEQGPGAAGHRDLLVLRAGARDAGNSRRAQAPKGVRLHRGETLCRVNPMSGAGPRDRQAREGGNRHEGSNPEGGTNRGWMPRVSRPPELLSL